MTVIMAIKKNKEVWIGSDTRITYGIDYKIDCSPEHDSKLVKLDTAIIGAAGDITMRNYLELFISRSDNASVPLTQKLEVIEFFINFKKFLKRHAGLGESEQNQVQNLMNTSWLVATKDKIFEYDQDGGIVEMAESCVIGSGAPAARAVIEYISLHQSSLSASKTMERAHEIAIKQNLACGGPQLQINVTKLLSKS